MRKLVCGPCLLLLVLACQSAVGAESQKLNVRRAAPADAYLVVWAMHNPERDFQRAYLGEVCETIRDTKLIETIVEIATANIPENELEQAKAVMAELQEAVAPADWHAMLDCQDFVYAQTMKQMPTAQHLALFRVTPEAAVSVEKAIQNLMGLVEKYSEGKVPSQTTTEGEATITTMKLPVPPQVPVSPTVIRIRDVLIVSSTEQLARQSLEMMLGSGGKSKSDDPRLKEALSHLPEPEDSLVFYDGKIQFQQMRGLGEFIRQASDGDPGAERAASMLDVLFDQLAFLDYEITVEYTEDNLNRSATYGKMLPGAEQKVLTKALFHGQPFADWPRWIPADALAYKLSTGANLHPVYEWAMATIKERFPEAEEGLEKFQAIQEQFDVHLDRDLLQAFSGESVSVTMPSARPSLLGAQDSFTALRCQKPERIRELLHRLVQQLQQIPAVQTQQLELKESESLDGFDELSAMLLNSLGAKPVIGFRDGWMIIGSTADAVQKVLDTRAGEGQTIDQSESFKQFNLPVEGPVQAIGYTNLAQSTRQGAAMLRQAGMFLPMVIGMAGANADDEWVQQVQKLVGLLPSVAQIVEKFDFLEAKLSVTQAGDQPGTYLRRSVTLVRPPSASD